MIKKLILSMGLLSSYIYAQEMFLYNANINVVANKVNGKPWDITGNAPDITIKIHGKILRLQKQCRDTYRCSIAFISDQKEFYIEVYDKDIINNDLIAKGNCGINTVCKLDGATLDIRKVLK